MASYESEPLTVYAREIMAAMLESGAVKSEPVRGLSEEVADAYRELLAAISKAAGQRDLGHIETAKNLALAMIRGKLIPRTDLQLRLQAQEVGEAFAIVLAGIALQQ